MKYILIACIVGIAVGCGEPSADGQTRRVYSITPGEYVFTDIKTFSYPKTGKTRKTRQKIHLCRVESQGTTIRIVVTPSSGEILTITGSFVGNEFSGTDDYIGGKTEYEGVLNSDGNLEGTLYGGREEKRWKGPFRVLPKKHFDIVENWMPSIRLDGSVPKEDCEQKPDPAG